ncbi:MAG: hypothetical protein QNK05_20975 [Myxococcota bacterium]|nr:hypothetical protein [Myxococcota bacterium]
MTIVYGQLDSGGNLVYGQLDQSLIVSYNHFGVDTLALSDNGTHQQDVIWEHGLGADYDIYAAGLHEYLPPPASVSYTHSGRDAISLFCTGAHEHIVPVVVHVHSGAQSLSLSDNGSHVHFPGAAGDYIHSASDTITISSSGAHGFTPSQFIITQQAVVPLLSEWLSDTPDQVTMDFSALGSEIDRVTFELSSTDPNFVAGGGPLGGVASAVVELVKGNGAVVPVVSLSSQYPRATLFDYPAQSEVFSELVGEMVAGPVTFRIGGYEALVDRSLPLSFVESSTLRVDALS